jgi:hypothetical protein
MTTPELPEPALDPHRTVAHLTALSRFEIDVIASFDLALEHLPEPALRDEVLRMKADAERHVLEMAEVLRALGAVPPAYVRDVRGYLMACVTALRSASGSDGSLRAIAAIARAAIERHRGAQEWDEPIELRAMFQGYEADYQRHLDALAVERAPVATPAG